MTSAAAKPCAFCGKEPKHNEEYDTYWCFNEDCCAYEGCAQGKELDWNGSQIRIAAFIRERERKAIEFAMRQVDYGSPEETKLAIARTFADWEREK